MFLSTNDWHKNLYILCIDLCHTYSQNKTETSSHGFQMQYFLVSSVWHNNTSILCRLQL